jgi:hypothetical protein
MPYTVTIVSTKPADANWWNHPEGSSNDLARQELFNLIAQQPGYISFDAPAINPDASNTTSTGVYVFDTQANYTAMTQVIAQHPAYLIRDAYNKAAGITFTRTAVAS